MLKLIATLGVFFNCLSILAAVGTTGDAGPGVSTATWEKEFRPIYSEAASYPRATALSDGRVMITFAHPTPVGKISICNGNTTGNGMATAAIVLSWINALISLISAIFFIWMAAVVLLNAGTIGK